MNTPIPSYKESFTGPLVIIGFGSIGSGLLPLLKRHLILDEKQIYIICPDRKNIEVAEEYKAIFITKALTPENFKSILSEILNDSTEKGFIINLATEVSSYDLIEFARENNSHYIDTVIEPWTGFYFNTEKSKSEQSNYALRESLNKLKLAHDSNNDLTAISCCGANPGMVSWFVKKALLDLARDTDLEVQKPKSQEDWVKLMFQLDVKGIHISEKDTQVTDIEYEPGTFYNTWSVEGCLAECLQPAELGWGTHEKTMPADGHQHGYGNEAAIYLDTPGAGVKVNTWTPTAGSHFGFLITHNEAISISDFFTLRENGKVIYRPTCHYAYHPSDATVKSIVELVEERNFEPQTNFKIFSEPEITSGADELGVLLYGHKKGAYWYGSSLTIDQTRELAPHQNATALQVTSAVLTGIIYALRHPNEGILGTDEMDFEECLAIQAGYLGTLWGCYTDWTPDQPKHTLDTDEMWQFSNLRINKGNN